MVGRSFPAGGHPCRPIGFVRSSGGSVGCAAVGQAGGRQLRSEEHTSELQSLMRISYAVFCLKKKPDAKKPDLKPLSERFNGAQPHLPRGHCATPSGRQIPMTTA